MMNLLPIAKAENYVSVGNVFRLSGNYFLALPGCVTNDPSKGAELYNDQLLKRFRFNSMFARDKATRLLCRYPSNRRVLKINRLLSGDKAFVINELSTIEKFLFGFLIRF